MPRLATALLCLLALAPAAPAAWSPPALLAEDDEGSLSALVGLPDGRTRVAVGDSRTKIDVALRDAPPGGAFGPAQTVLRGEGAFATSFAADGSGATVQLQGTRRTRTYRVVPFDAAGTPGDPYPLGNAETADLAVSPAGAAAVVWLRRSGEATEVLAAFREAGSTAFGPPLRAGFALDRESLVDVGVGDSGEAVVTWQVNGFPSPLAAAVRLPGAAFSRPRFVTREAYGSNLAVAPDGHVIIEASADRRLRVATKRPGEATMPPVRAVDRAAASFDGTRVAAASGGQVGVVWPTAGRRLRDTELRVYLGTVQGGLRRVALAARKGGGPALAVDAAGRAVVAWGADRPNRRGDPTHRERLALAYKPAGGRFRRPTLVGPTVLSATPIAISLTPQGRAAAAFEAFEDSATRSFRRALVTRYTP